MREALAKTGTQDRDAAKFGRDHVSVRALGTSAVLQLSVKDRSPRIAAPWPMPWRRA